MTGKKGLLAVMSCTLLWDFCQRMSSRKDGGKKNSIRIGVSLYRGDDTFINNIRSELEKQAKSYEQQTGIRVTFGVFEDSKGNQNTQNNQVERLISLGCDVLCINPVDRTNATVMIDKAMTAQVPVVFFDRSAGGRGYGSMGSAVLYLAWRQRDQL